MSGVTLQLDGRDEALDQLAGYVSRLSNPRPMWESIGQSLVTSTQRRFETGTAPDGSPWPPSLRALAEGGKTLVKSARLMQSITSNASGSGVEVGTNVIYAAIHQLGGLIQRAARSVALHFKRSKKTGERLQGFRKARDGNETRTASVGAHTIRMPARPFLGLDDDDQVEMVRIAEDFVMAGASP